jgi:outer membrane protein assembly factor BamB
MKLSGAVAMMFAAALSTVVIASPLSDWPQWRGPDRSGVSAETGLLQQWPQNGPPPVWTVQSLGAGYGSLAVAGDRIFVQSLRNRQSIVTAMNPADGREIWSKNLGPGGENDRGSGPRSTPTVDGDRSRADRKRRPRCPGRTEPLSGSATSCASSAAGTFPG